MVRIDEHPLAPGADELALGGVYLDRVRPFLEEPDLVLSVNRHPGDPAVRTDAFGLLGPTGVHIVLHDDRLAREARRVGCDGARSK